MQTMGGPSLMAIFADLKFGTSNRKPWPTVNCEMDERRKKFYSSSKPWKKDYLTTTGNADGD